MRASRTRWIDGVCRLLFLTALAAGGADHALAQVVPGTGEKAEKVGDDFEDPEWAYIYNLPKSSSIQDKQVRMPSGKAKNGSLYESTYRGQPDVIKRVPTPEGGLPGSEGALLIQTRISGIPGAPSHESQQDDLMMNTRNRMGGFVPVSWSPSCVVRVFLPPFEQWERRSGTSFAFRADCRTHTVKAGSGMFASSKMELEPYWPGIFIQHVAGPQGKESAHLIIRGGVRGHDFRGPEITELGWWTLGMSFTPDGKVHYYASPGVDDLTAADHISSQFPYGFRCERFETFFFNVCSQDNGRTWSTPWIIDDPSLYYIRK